MNAFTYSIGDHTPLANENTRLAIIPAGIQKKTGLLSMLAANLKFPDYFGGNWDALEECLADLSWIPEGQVILYHKDLPLIENPIELRNYLQVLENAVAERVPVILKVIFQEQYRNQIITLLAPRVEG